MSEEKKRYRITDRAGHYVAGHKLQMRLDGDGNPLPVPGQSFDLTDAEARYELLNGVIELAEPEPAAPRPRPQKAE